MNDIEKVLKYFSDYSDNLDNLKNIVRTHFGLLRKWQKIANLIGLTDERDIAEFLYLDSYLALNNVYDFLIKEKIILENQFDFDQIEYSH